MVAEFAFDCRMPMSTIQHPPNPAPGSLRRHCSDAVCGNLDAGLAPDVWCAVVAPLSIMLPQVRDDGNALPPFPMETIAGL